MSAKVQSIALNSANIRYSNDVNESRTHDIQANVTIQNNEVSSFDRGEVKLNEVLMATFSRFGEGNEQYFFHVSLSSAEKYEIMLAIDEFITDVTSVVSTNTLNI